MRKKENMNHRYKLWLFVVLVCCYWSGGQSAAAAVTRDVDICVYGGTASGVMSAYAAKKMGKTVLLIEPGKYLGGMTTSGLGFTDAGRKEAVTGLSRLFYRKIGGYYNKFEEWYFPPSVATSVINDFVREGELDVEYYRRIVSSEVSNGKIVSITLEDSRNPSSEQMKVTAKVFIDCTYEGDLMARSGVSYSTGREGNDVFGETKNGIQLAYYHQFPDGVDPYKVKGDPSSGLCWGVSDEPFGVVGQGDNSVQAYNYRLSFTKDPANMVPFTRPDSYNREQYELLARAIEKMDESKKLDINSYFAADAVAGGKFDVNNRGAFSTNMIGMNHDYPEASYERRAEICKAQEEHIRGLFYFLTTDEAVPEELRNKVKAYGWSKDEFTDNNHFPPQIYVREARRMNGEYVMTQHNCERTTVVEDGVALASYAMDSHNCRRVIVNGMVKNEGDVQVGLGGSFPISYRSIVPKREECTNLLVPVCVSSSHIAYGSIRMEPVFMALGQSAAMAAAMSIDDNCSVQEIDVNKLKEQLENDPYLDGSGPDVEEGAGTAEDPYLIRNVYQLSQVSSHLDAHFKLVADIDLTGIGWNAIGGILKPFAGSFDGNGYSITGINIVAKGQFSGLFGAAIGATIKNVWLKNCTVTQTATGSGDDVGLLVGYAESTVIENCAVQGTLDGGAKNNMGGLVGRTGGTASVKISDCYIDASVSGNRTIGSIVGAATAPTIIDRCFVMGKIYSPDRAGAAVGLTNKAASSFTGIIATDLIIEDTSGAGTGTDMNRIIGGGSEGTYNNNIASPTVTFASINGKTINSGLNTKDGLTKSIEELKSMSTYTAVGYQFGSDAARPWTMEEGGSYPQLWYMDSEWVRPVDPTEPGSETTHHILPLPKSIVPADGDFEITSAVTIIVASEDAALRKVVEGFVSQVKLSSGIELQLTGEQAPSTPAIRFETDATIAEEGYELLIEQDAVVIKSSTAVGAFYAVQSMYQLLPPAVCANHLTEGLQLKMKCGEIKDEPRFAYRGMHLDVARFFMPVEFIKQYIDLLALHKINHFHWHLTDDQGWRIEIKQYPRLIEVGSVRPETAIGYTGQYDGKEHRGHYTQEQAREIVAYAAERFITVVPEIEMPGHATAALAAYPELSCFPDKSYEVKKEFGIFTDLMCPKEGTFTFLENVLKELFDIFPSDYYHIGGDECEPLKSSWSKCEHCQGLISSMGLADEVALQNYFMNRIATFMKANNKQVIGWNEILKGGSELPDNAMVMSWTGGASEAVAQNRKVIMTPWNYAYLDYYQIGEDVEKEDNLSVGGFTPLHKVYGYEPVPAGLTAEQENFVFGVQGNCWTEFMPTKERVMYQVIPRGLAIAELGWTAKENKDYDSFRKRVASDYPRLEAKGFTPGKAFYKPVFVFEKDNTYPKRLEMTLGYPYAEIRYTLDGSEPTASSAVYTQALELPQGTVIKAAAFENGEQIGETSGVWFGDGSFFLPGKFEKGDGSSENPYEITNVYQLDAVRNNLNACYRLMNDLDMTGVTFSPIGSITVGKHFAGTFDGNGYMISNVKVNGGSWIGFFGVTSNCTIKNLFLKDVKVSASGDYAGGLAGYMIGGQIINCAVTGEVVANGTVTTQYGGLVGLTGGDKTANKTSISDCYVDVNLKPVAGVAGIVAVADIPTSINRCIVNGHFYSENRGGAAINIGKSDNVSVSALVAGSLTLERVGTTGSVNWYNRIVGENRIATTLSDNMADGDNVSFVNLEGKEIVSGGATLDGMTRTTAELKSMSTYVELGYKFGNEPSSPWMIAEGEEYPKLCFMDPEWEHPEVWDNEVEEEGMKGDGTPGNPYQITTVEELDFVRSNLTSCYLLMNDLDMTGVAFSPIGGILAGKEFAGTFDGGGHTISNVKVSGGGWIGFFGVTKNCTIKNLFMKDVNVSASADYAGGLAGYMIGGHIFNCAVTGEIVANGTGTTHYGGLVGLTSGDKAVNRTSISDCHVDIILKPVAGTAGAVAVAGIPTSIDRCIINGHFYAGNKAGAAIDLCMSNNVSVSGLVAGNLTIERVGTTVPLNWFNRIIGENRTAASLSNNMVDETNMKFVNLEGKEIVSGPNSLDGMTKTTAELQMKATYEGLGYVFGEDESSPWTIVEGAEYPKLWFMTEGGSSSTETITKKNLSVRVYPVPCDQVLYVDGADIASIKLYTTSGLCVGEYADAEINVSSLSTGVYFVKVQTATGLETYRIIKK